MKTVVVTGASTGIGWGTVKILIENGFRVFGSVRKQADAERLSREFGANFVPLYFDVTDEAAVQAAAAEVDKALAGETLFGLVNNAGIAISGPLLYLTLDEVRRQIEVNVVGQLNVTQAFAPLLGTDRSRRGSPGRIVQISSIGGKTAMPFLGAYGASKFGVEGVSEGLRRELMLFGIDVIVIGPGAVATPIWDKAREEDDTRFANTPYAASLARMKDMIITQGKKGLPPEKLGEAVMHALTAAHPKVRYAVLPSRVEGLVMNMMPKRLMDRLVAKRLGLVPVTS
jgi:NAD(P)-dependent dehydrogenase (short-subunit alcohol dehydrogenase family)